MNRRGWTGGGPTAPARAYAVRELARRAGVAPAQLRSWRIEIGERRTTAFPFPGSPARIEFPHAREHYWHRLEAGALRTVRAGWPSPPPADTLRLVPDFPVPWAEPAGASGGPLFVPEGEAAYACAVDLPASILANLSRAEELLSPRRDEFDRFPSAESAARRDDFLHRPVVDEYGLALEQVLRLLQPGWRPAARELRCHISHDIDRIGIPFRLQATMGHTLLRRRPKDTLHDLAGLALRWEPTWLRCVREVSLDALRRGLGSAVYWKAPPRSDRDAGYDPRLPRIRKVIGDLKAAGAEQGVHPGFYTFRDPERLAAEVRIVREATGEEAMGGRQHYLRWSPESWYEWEQCGLAYDCTVGYPDRIGFRAGTSYAYHPWLLEQDRPAALLEIPLLVMDGTLPVSCGPLEEESVRQAGRLIERCRLTGGVFSLLWHNSEYNAPYSWRVCRRILDALWGARPLDWRRELPA